MKNTVFIMSLVIMLAACAPAQPNTADIQNTAIALAWTDYVLTQTAQPMETLPPPPTFTLTIVFPTPSLLPTQLTFPVTLDPAEAQQQEEIKDVIYAYFDLRYQARSVSPPEGFQLEDIGNLVSNKPDGKAFLDAELGKLTLELKYAELNHSRYVDSKYFLNFSNFTTDIVAELVTVTVVEDSETISENSAKNNPANPLVAQMSGLEHTIVLRKEQGQWKIVSDYYGDFLWRTIRKKGEDIGEEIRRLNTVIAQQITPTATPTP